MKYTSGVFEKYDKWCIWQMGRVINGTFMLSSQGSKHSAFYNKYAIKGYFMVLK